MPAAEAHEDGGLHTDALLLNAARYDRRAVMAGFGLASAALTLAGCRGGPPPGVADNAELVTATGADGAQCLNWTQETNGPYPADGTNQSSGEISNALTQLGIERSDIRADLGNGGRMAPGVPLTIQIALADVNADCAPLARHAVYLWHCDAGGKYSLYDLPQRSYLRGLQVSDDRGIVQFRTIVPGCYRGRYPHMHFEVFSSRENAVSGKFASLVSQIAIDTETCSRVYGEVPAYANSLAAFDRNNAVADDMVFADNGTDRIAAMTLACTGSAEAGFRGKSVVGIAK